MHVRGAQVARDPRAASGPQAARTGPARPGTPAPPTLRPANPNSLPMRQTVPAILTVLAALTLGAPAFAANRCPETSTMRAYPPVVSLRVDNDLFANRDEGY